MKKIIRIISFTSRFKRTTGKYTITVLLSSLFNLFNFTLLIPLLDIVFGQISDDKIEELRISSEGFQFDIDTLYNLFYQYLHEKTIEHGQFYTLLLVLLVIVASVFFKNLFLYLGIVILAQLRLSTIKNIRKALYEKLLALHIGFFSNTKKGDIISRFTSDISQIENNLSAVLSVFLRDPIHVLLFVIALFSISVELTLFTIIVLPLAGYIIAYIAKMLRKQAKGLQESVGRLYNIIGETLDGIKIIKAFNAKQYVSKRFQEENVFNVRKMMSLTKRLELAGPLSEFLSVTVVVGIILYGGNLVLTGEMSPSKLIAYVIIYSQVISPIKAITTQFSNIQRTLVSADRVFELMDTKVDIVNKRNAKKLKVFEKSIIFKNVSFKYEEEMVLENINFTLKKGKTLALVGHSGGGKSTLADLVSRFYDPVKGETLIDGINIKDYDLTSLYQHIGIVSQDPIVFNDSIFNNISFGIENAKKEDVIKAAKIANAHEFIMRLSKKYQTEIGERGIKLSGGQRQRISIARAVLKNPSILILDEATSSLDSESEKLVQEAIYNLMSTRTSIIIAHRLSTIMNVDNILVIKDGKIREKGTHKELIQHKGIYKKLTEMQGIRK